MSFEKMDEKVPHVNWAPFLERFFQPPFPETFWMHVEWTLLSTDMSTLQAQSDFLRDEESQAPSQKDGFGGLRSDGCGALM